jgi:hypothetical protein
MSPRISSFAMPLRDHYRWKPWKGLIFSLKAHFQSHIKSHSPRMGSNVSAYCTCPAGVNGQYCKHRFGILAGSDANLIDHDPADVATVSSWLPGSDIETAWVEVKQLEHEAEQIKVQLSKAKKALAKAMRD